MPPDWEDQYRRVLEVLNKVRQQRDDALASLRAKDAEIERLRAVMRAGEEVFKEWGAGGWDCSRHPGHRPHDDALNRLSFAISEAQSNV